MGRDFQSPCLKNAKHFNSFQTPFLVSLDDIAVALDMGEAIQQRFQLDTAEEDMKKRSLCCHRCGLDFGRRFADLKKHLATCQAEAPACLVPSCWQQSKVLAEQDAEQLSSSRPESVARKRPHGVIDLT